MQSEPIIINLDMDGVISNFSLHLFNRYQTTKLTGLWNIMAEGDFWETIPPMFLGFELVERLKSEIGGIDIRILSSIGNSMDERIISQKVKWLAKFEIFHGMTHQFTTASKGKHPWASPNSFLIDDRAKLVNSFVEHGGGGFVFNSERPKHVHECLNAIRLFKKKQDI